jgi:hypothetical protein
VLSTSAEIHTERGKETVKTTKERRKGGNKEETRSSAKN